ncbi:MAG: pitrilysin family protein, partial [Pseudomonadota bacterium]
MRKYYPTLLLLLLVVQPAGGKTGAPQNQKVEGDEKMTESPEKEVDKLKGNVLPVEAEVRRLKNGLTVTLVPFDSPGLVAYYTAMRVGSRDEVEKGRSGFAHLFEHMMFRGTKNLPGSEYDNTVTAMGADSSAWTWNDQTVYFFVAPTQKIGKVIEMEAERFKNLYYSQEDFKTESGAVLGEYNKNFSNPINKLEEVMWDKAFKKHTYKHTTMGFIEDIREMPTMYDYSLQFFDRHYVPGKALIFVIGDFDSKTVIERIEKHYSDWAGEPHVSKTPDEPAQTKEIRTHISWKNPVLPILLMGYKIPAYGASGKESAALVLAGEMLFGKAGPLYRKLVLDEKSAEKIEYWDWQQRDPGLFIIEARLKEDKFDPVIASIDEQIEKLRGGSFDAERLEKARSNYKYGLLLSLDTARNVARQMAFYATLDGDPMGLDTFLGSVEAVTAGDIANVAEKFLVPQKRTVATLS